MVEGLRSGEPVACQAFWQCYGPLLEGIAERQLSARVQRRIGADDIVQSACRTFFRRVSDGQFDLPDSNALWRLMCGITVTKARRAARDQHRLKRGIQRECSFDADASTEGSPMQHLTDGTASPFELSMVADELETLLRQLSADECQVLELKLQQLTNDEIAERLGCSERTIRRLTKAIQARWQSLFDTLVA